MQERRLAAIMFTDIAGYTALMGSDEERAFLLLKKNRQVQKPIIEKHDGKWLKEIGDGVLASFPTVSEAVYCAKEIQKACEKEPDLKLRIGIHLGEVVFDDEDVFGDGVNIASRLEPLAPVGGIYISESVFRNIQNKKGIETEFIREETLKNVKHPVRIYEVNVEKEIKQAEHEEERMVRSKFPYILIVALVIIIAGILIWNNQPKKPNGLPATEDNPNKEISIAVLPFDNLSGDPEQEVMCDGLTEEIIHYLSIIKEFDKVISRSSIMTFKDSNKTIPEVAKLLNVNFILEGSYRQSGNRLRITAQLIEASSDNHLWTEIYERPAGDIFDIQSDIAKKIASNLKGELSTGENKQIAKRPTDNLEAYSLYLKGRYFWNKRTKEGFNEAIKYYQDAIEKDNNYALAYAGLADCYINASFYEYIPPQYGCEEAKIPLTKVFKIDNNLSEAYASMALLMRNCEWDWDSSLHSIERAIQLNPNNANAHLWYSGLLSLLGFHNEAIIEAKRAQALDPLSPFINSSVAIRLYYARKFDQAIEEASKALIINPDFYLAHNFLGLAYLQKGMFTKAVEHMKLAEMHSGKSFGTKATLGYVYGKIGNFREAQIILDSLKECSKKEYVSPISIARVYIGIGEEEQAINYLEKAFEEKENRLIRLNSNPIYDPLRSNPRYKKLLEKMNLSK